MSADTHAGMLRGTMGAAVAALVIAATPAAAQDEPDRPCTILCAPELKIEPTFTIEHLAQRHRVEVDGAVERVSREQTFELIFALDIPTEIPRIGLTLEAIFVPFGDTAVHPFTGVRRAKRAGSRFATMASR